MTFEERRGMSANVNGSIKISVLRDLAAYLDTTVAYLADGVKVMEQEETEEKELLELFKSLQNPAMKKIVLEQLRVLVEMV